MNRLILMAMNKEANAPWIIPLAPIFYVEILCLT